MAARETHWNIWEVELDFTLCQWYGGILSYKSVTKSKLTAPSIDTMMMQFFKHCAYPENVIWYETEIPHLYVVMHNITTYKWDLT